MTIKQIIGAILLFAFATFAIMHTVSDFSWRFAVKVLGALVLVAGASLLICWLLFS